MNYKIILKDYDGRHIAYVMNSSNKIIYEYVIDEETYEELQGKNNVMIDTGDKVLTCLVENQECYEGTDLDNNMLSTITRGEALRNKVNTNIRNSNGELFSERDFVDRVVNYVESKAKVCCQNLVLVIAGIRGVGKTTGLLQAINRIGDYENTAFIDIAADDNIDCKGLNGLIQRCGDAKYIFIDEITNVTGFVKGSAFLKQRYCDNGKIIVISGTDSLALVSATGHALFNRAICDNVTYISSIEAERTLGQSFKDYINQGGLYESEVINSSDSLNRYVTTAIVDNIINTMIRNKSVTELLNLENRDIRDIRTLVFDVLYSIVYEEFKGDTEKSIDLSGYLSLYRYDFDIISVKDTVLNQFNVGNKIDIQYDDIRVIIDSLIRLGIILRIDNLCKEKNRKGQLSRRYKLYITNPSMATQITSILKTRLESLSVDKGYGNIENRRNGLLLESILICFVRYTGGRLGCETNYYRNDFTGEEIDIVLSKNELYLYFEIKYTDNIDIAIEKSKWINEVNKGDSRVKGRYILYNGETRKVGDIELINIVEFIGNFKNYIEILNKSDY